MHRQGSSTSAPTIVYPMLRRIRAGERMLKHGLAITRTSKADDGGDGTTEGMGRWKPGTGKDEGRDSRRNMDHENLDTGAVVAAGQRTISREGGGKSNKSGKKTE
jgi:hypothetical protein